MTLMTLPAPLTKGLTFALGLGFAFLPAYGPFIGLLLLLSSRWRWQRSDIVWWSAALLLALPLALHGSLRDFALGALQVLAPWLIYRAFTKLHESKAGRESLESSWVGVGLMTGLVLVVALGLFQALGGVLPGTWPEVLEPFPRDTLYGHMVLTLGALVAILLPSLPWQVLSLGLSALGILVSGSREAALAWIIVALAVSVVGKTRAPQRRLTMGIAIAVILIASALLGPLFGWGRAGFLIDVAPPPAQGKNLLQGTENATGEWWDPVGVRVQNGELALSQAPLTTYLVTKLQPGAGARVQQVVSLAKGEAYTVSLWLWREDKTLEPGIRGSWQRTEPGETLTLEGALRQGTWQAAASGPGRVLESGTLETRGLWQRVYTTFVYEGRGQAVDGWLGFAPDQRGVAGSEAAFAGLQLERGLTPTPYTAAPATRGLSLQRTRLALWQTAWQGFAQAPLWGQNASFADFFRARWPDQEAPTHAHSLPLQILFERGILGFGGLLLFVFALAQVALRKGDAALLAVLAALIAANLFDITLFSGQILYPLAAVAGWRAGVYRYARTGERDSAMRQLGVRLSLMFTDFVMALIAFNLAILVRQLAGTWFDLPPIYAGAATLEVARYALLLWPVLAWREGLYPGYGLTEPQELQKQVASAAYAGLILAVGTVLFTRELIIPRSILVLTILFSMVLAPVGRALIKTLLNRAQLWGRAVVILGAGKAGRRIARSLSANPLDGLHPIAFFDDDPSKQGLVIEGLPVRGKLSDADLFAMRRGVQHAIVAIPTATPQLLSGLINTRGRIFRRVQFIPDLVNLPSQGVYASDLDGMLALEVRLGLYSKFNQAVKRTVDLFGSVVGGVLISPIILALTLWVRRDSPGSAFYWSTRIGQQGKPFKCLKFRSMYTDADERLKEMMRDDPKVREEYETYHKLENDPRITRAGAFIRKYSLDELTQLFNVLRGEMSLVGPRPYLVQELPDMRGMQDVILEAKPGMTGYWQVTGRADVTFEERLEMESQYVRNWSLWWDIIILVQTVMAVVARRGAR